MAELTGKSEAHALIQVWGTPPNAPAVAGNIGASVGTHAVAFTGRAESDDDLEQEIWQKKEALDDPDSPFDWDLDITVGPKWRSVKQVAASVAVGRVWSDNADTDNMFEFNVKPRTPPWSVSATTTNRIVLHVRVTQAGERVMLLSFLYTVTATGELEDITEFIS